jgi:hypothetical protein
MSETVYTERCAKFAGYAVKIGLNSHLRKRSRWPSVVFGGFEVVAVAIVGSFKRETESEVPSVCG